MRYFLGNPGASGAAVVISETPNFYMVCRFKESTEARIAERLKNQTLGGVELFAAIEKVSAMPKQGVSSMFKFGDAAGFVRGLLTAYGIPFRFVLPRTWQKEFGLSAKYASTTERKNAHKQRAEQLFGMKLTLDVADAFLIAEWLRRQEVKP